MKKDDECLFLEIGRRAQVRREAEQGERPESRWKSSWLACAFFLPALPAYQELGGKVSLSYSMSYEGFLPAPPASRKFLSLNRRKPAP